MLIVRIELHHAVTGRVTEIGRMRIINTDAADMPVSVGNYSVELCKVGSSPTSNKRQRFGTVLGYPRLTANVWELIGLAIRSVLSPRGDKATTEPGSGPGSVERGPGV